MNHRMTWSEPMDIIIDKLISNSNKKYKLINDIPNELKFIFKKNISGKKYKPIPVTLADVWKGKKSKVVHSVSLSVGVSNIWIQSRGVPELDPEKHWVPWDPHNQSTSN